jgi:hypothetical protein
MKSKKGTPRFFSRQNDSKTFVVNTVFPKFIAVLDKDDLKPSLQIFELWDEAPAEKVEKALKAAAEWLVYYSK